MGLEVAGSCFHVGFRKRGRCPHLSRRLYLLWQLDVWYLSSLGYRFGLVVSQNWLPSRAFPSSMVTHDHLAVRFFFGNGKSNMEVLGGPVEEQRPLGSGVCLILVLLRVETAMVEHIQSGSLP